MRFKSLIVVLGIVCVISPGTVRSEEGPGKLEFLDPEEIEKIKVHAGEHVQGAELKTVAYDEQGRQYGSPKPRFIKKTGAGRGCIVNYPQPF